MCCSKYPKASNTGGEAGSCTFRYQEKGDRATLLVGSVRVKLNEVNNPSQALFSGVGVELAQPPSAMVSGSVSATNQRMRVFRLSRGCKWFMGENWVCAGKNRGSVDRRNSLRTLSALNFKGDCVVLYALASAHRKSEASLPRYSVLPLRSTQYSGEMIISSTFMP